MFACSASVSASVVALSAARGTCVAREGGWGSLAPFLEAAASGRIGAPTTERDARRARQERPARHRLLRPSDAHRHDRHAGAKRQVGSTVTNVLDARSGPPSAFREKHERLAPGENGERRRKRLTIRSPAANGKSAE